MFQLESEYRVSLTHVENQCNKKIETERKGAVANERSAKRKYAHAQSKCRSSKKRKVVTKHLKKITSATAKYNALKENIMIRVKGFSWDWCKHPWSKDGRKYTIKELADHLRWIIKEEKKHSIPDEPLPNVPQQISLPVLGTQTEDILELDRKYLANEDEFKEKARKLRNERELKGEGSMYSSMQPFVRPEISDLMNERIDVLSEFKMLGKEERELRWCQGEVVHVYEEQRVPMVCVRWDPIPDCTGWECSTESNQTITN